MLGILVVVNSWLVQDSQHQLDSLLRMRPKPDFSVERKFECWRRAEWEFRVRLTYVTSAGNGLFQELRHFLVQRPVISILNLIGGGFVEEFRFPSKDLEERLTSELRSDEQLAGHSLLTLFNFRKMHGFFSGNPYFRSVLPGEQFSRVLTSNRQYLSLSAPRPGLQFGSAFSS